MINHCKHCGAELPEGRSFCLACGKPQRAEPVLTPPPRRRSRLIWPVLLLAVVIACSPLLHRSRNAVFLPAEKPAAPTAADSPVTGLKSPPDTAIPTPDESGQKEPDNSEAAESAQPDLSAPSQPVPTPSVTPAPANAGASQESQPAVDPWPEPEYPPDPPDPQEPDEPVFADGSAEQLQHWTEAAQEIPTDRILSPGITYCIARPGDPGKYRVFFLRILPFTDENGYQQAFFGDLSYVDYTNSEYDPVYDTVFDGTAYHWQGEGWCTSLSVSSGYAPSSEHRFIRFYGGGTIVEQYLSSDGAVIRGPVLNHYGTGPLFGGFLDHDLTPYLGRTLIPRSDPGFLSAVEHLYQIHFGT